MTAPADPAYVDWLAKARRLVPIVEAHWQEGEQECRLPKPIFDAIHAAGFFSMWVPKTLGGAEV
jgi:indole-3-acetate monooxygenase